MVEAAAVRRPGGHRWPVSRVCPDCRAEADRWLDSNPERIFPIRGFAFGSGAPYDLTSAAIANRRRARYERWRSLVREQTAAIREGCAAGLHARPSTKESTDT